MAMHPHHKELSERLRELVEKEYPQRGRFTELEKVSGISSNRWKNFYYRKQEATQEMTQFWCNSYPIESDWLLSGVKAPEQKDFPFGARIPTRHEGQTIADRLNWVISEWASPKGEQLFNYLEQRSKGKILAAEWAQLILKAAAPTVEMITVVCQARPHFAEWIINGHVQHLPQVDPTNQESVKRWKDVENASWENMMNAAKQSTQPHDD
jgi:hypothetical protein